MFTGNRSDKALAKVLDRDEKRKRSTRDDRDKDRGKRRPRSSGFNKNNLGYQGYQNWTQQLAGYPPAVFQPPPPPPPPTPQMLALGYQRNDRVCAICKQSGHWHKQCPNKPTPPAALGVPK